MKNEIKKFVILIFRVMGENSSKFGVILNTMLRNMLRSEMQSRTCYAMGCTSAKTTSKHVTKMTAVLGNYL